MADEDEPMEEENIKEEKPCGLNLQRAISTSMDSRLFHHLVSLSLSLYMLQHTQTQHARTHRPFKFRKRAILVKIAIVKVN